MSRARRHSDQRLPGPAYPDSPIRVEVVHEFGPRSSAPRVQISPTNACAGVVVVARDPRQRIAVVRQFRATLGTEMWELPRGFGRSKAPVDDAARELEEETGARAVRLQSLGAFHPDTGLQRQQVVAVRAWVADAIARPIGTGEVAEVAWWSEPERHQAIVDGVLCDGISLAALLLDALTPAVPGDLVEA